jgi:hypothetical protein
MCDMKVPFGRVEIRTGVDQAQDGLVRSEAQLAAPEKAKTKKEAHGEGERTTGCFADRGVKWFGSRSAP